MAKQVQLRRGTTAQLSSVTGAEGEVIVDTTKDTLTVHDGYTAGGVPLLKENLSNLGNNTIGLGKIATGTQGQVLYYNASGQLVVLDPGTAGQILKTNGAGQNPSWTNGGKLVKVHTYRNDTRFVTSSSSNYNYFTWTLTKVSSTSTLVFHVIMPGMNNTNSGDFIGIGIDGSYDFGGQGNVDANTQGNFVTIVQYRSGVSAGSKTITLNAIPLDGSSNRTIDIINPNNSDDARNRQQATVFVVYEIEP